MKYIWLFCLIIGISHFSIGQNDIISVSKSGFYYYDGYPFKVATPDIPINLGYERIIAGKYGLKIHFELYNDLIYHQNNRSDDQDLGQRDFGALTLSFKRYYDLSDNIKIYPTTKLVLRSTDELWLIPITMRPHFVTYSHDKIGLGVGGGIQYHLFDRIMIETEVSHTEYLYTISTDNEYVTEEDNVGNSGSDHELRVSLSVGYMF